MATVLTEANAGTRRPAAATALGAAEIAVAALTVAAFVLRFTQIHQALVGDEVLAYNEVVGRTLSQTFHLVHTGLESSPPLFFVFAWLSVKLGDPSVWIRLPSVVLGTATVPVVYLVGREVAGRAAGVIAAGLIALAPFSVYYGIEARPYATMMLFVALSTLALLYALRTGSRRWLVAYVICAAAAMYSHYTCVFVLAVQALWALWAHREQLRPLLVANAAIVLLYVPWLPELHGRYLSVYGSLYAFTAPHVLGDLLRPLPGHPSAPLRGVPTVAGLVVFGICALAGLGALIRARRAGLVTPIALMAGATPIGVLLYSLIGTDIWLPRNLSASLPATAVLLGAGVLALPRPATLIAGTLMGAVLLAGTLRSFEPAYNRGPFRTIAAYVDRTAGPQDPVTLMSLLGAGAVPAETRRPHLVLRTVDRWQNGSAGATGIIVLDDTIARLFKITTPHPAGFRLIARKHYAGSVPTDVLTYARVS
jgi:hypothetical protein